MLPGEQKTKPDHRSAQGSRIRFCLHFKWHREEGKIKHKEWTVLVGGLLLCLVGEGVCTQAGEEG